MILKELRGGFAALESEGRAVGVVIEAPHDAAWSLFFYETDADINTIAIAAPDDIKIERI